MDDTSQIIVGLLSGGGGASAGGAMVWFLIRNLIESLTTKVSGLEARLVNLQENHLAGMDRRITDMEKGCPARHDRLSESLRSLDRLAEEQKNTNGWLKKIDTKVDRLAEDNAALKTASAADHEFIADVARSVRAHHEARDLHRD
jgi:hypothetical protein